MRGIEVNIGMPRLVAIGRAVLVGSALATLAGCSPALAPRGTASGLPALHGRIEHLQIPLPPSGLPDRRAQALTTDIANGATVSFIEMDTGRTVVTAVSSTDGNFDLTLPQGFSYPAGKPYALEAVKGLGIGTKFNRAGASLARVRTIVAWQFGWSSLTGPGIVVSPASTALSIIAGHKDLPTADLVGLIGLLNGSAFGGTSNVPAADFNHVLGIVREALSEDQDPVEAVSFSASGGTPELRFARKPGNVVIHDAASPAVVSIGETVTVTGQNLPTTGPSTPSLSMAGVPVATWSVNATRNRLAFPVPIGAYAGYLEIRQGAASWLGPFIRVRGTVGTFAGFNEGGAFRDGPGPWARLEGPHEMVFDNAGYLYVGANNRIRRITPGGNVTTFAGNGAVGTQDGVGIAATFNMAGVYRDLAGNLYLKMYGDNRVARLGPDASVATYLAPNSLLSMPHQVTGDSAGNLYVADFGTHTVKKITPAGAVSVVAGSSGASGTSDGSLLGARFNNPSGVAFDASGKVLIVNDRSNRRVRKLDLDANKTYTLTPSSGWVQNPASGPEDFSCPQNVVTGPDGSYYVAEFCGPDRVRKITASGVVSTVAGSSRGYRDGPIASALLSLPHGLAVDSNGVLYVAEYYQQRIRAIVP